MACPYQQGQTPNEFWDELMRGLILGMTITEAEEALDSVPEEECEPLSEDRIKEIVDYATKKETVDG